MCRMHKNAENPVGQDRREFCRLGGNVVVGMMALSSLAQTSSALGPGTGNALAGEATAGERGADMEGKKVTSVRAKVISVKGECGFGHKVGDTVKISESGVDGKICIHALYSMLPAAFAMLYDVKFPWLQDPDTKTHPCTDAANPVVFELTKIRV